MRKTLFAIVLVVTTAVSMIHAQQVKPVLVILDVTTIGTEESKGKIVYSYMLDLINKSGNYTIVERGELDRALKEIEFSSSGLVDDSTAVKIGKMTGAQAILISSLTKEEERFYLSMRVIQIETAQVTRTSVRQADSFDQVEQMLKQAVNYLFVSGPADTEPLRKETLRKELSAAVDALALLLAPEQPVSEGEVAEALELRQRLDGAEFRFPDLEAQAVALNDELSRRLSTQRTNEAQREYERKLTDLEALLRAGAPAVLEDDVRAAERLSVELATSPLPIDDLRTRGRGLVRELKVKVLEDRKTTLLRTLMRRTMWSGRFRSAGWVSVAIGAASIVLAGVAYGFGSDAYAEYQAASTAEAAVGTWGRVSTLAVLLNVGIVGGSVGSGLGAFLFLSAPSTMSLAAEIKKVEGELQALREQGR